MGLWLGLNSGLRPLRTSRSAAHGAQVITPLDYTVKLTVGFDSIKYIQVSASSQMRYKQRWMLSLINL